MNFEKMHIVYLTGSHAKTPLLRRSPSPSLKCMQDVQDSWNSWLNMRYKRQHSVSKQ